MKAIKQQIVNGMAILMTLAIVLGTFLSSRQSAYAQEQTYSFTITNNGNTEHQLEAYQIFSGDVSEDGGKKILANIAWGEHVEGADSLGNALKKAESLKSESEALKFAEELVHENKLKQTQHSITVKAGQQGTFSNLKAGYYLVKDKDNSQKADGAYTLYIMQIVGDAQATTKLDVPKVEKKVQENSNQAWQDAADYNFDEKIPYKITGSLPSNYDKYDNYHYSFIDEMSKGLTYNEDAKVFVVNGDETNKKEITKQAKITQEKTDKTTLKVLIEDLKKITADDTQTPVTINNTSKILVEYSAKLNKDAIIGKDGNPNDVYLEYSNNPNKEGDGEYGKTPKDRNIVFTYKVVVNKVDEKQKPLEGAEFTLYKVKGSLETPVGKAVVSGNNTVFSFEKLDAGEYILKETKVPQSYNKIPDVKFKITASYDIESPNPTLKDLKGNETIINLGILTFTPDVEKGSLSTNVVNKKGITLPSTGGMGTYIIYGMGFVCLAYVLGVLLRRKCKR
ncbi:MAG TPA: isopeptide-forming domain-containing fimbrial protein [Lachnospiraceae bacterium]